MSILREPDSIARLWWHLLSPDFHWSQRLSVLPIQSITLKIKERTPDLQQLSMTVQKWTVIEAAQQGYSQEPESWGFVPRAVLGCQSSWAQKPHQRK